MLEVVTMLSVLRGLIERLRQLDAECRARRERHRILTAVRNIERRQGWVIVKSASIAEELGEPHDWVCARLGVMAGDKLLYIESLAYSYIVQLTNTGNLFLDDWRFLHGQGKQ